MTEPLPNRWYVVSRYGVATLCVDERHAKSVAVSFNTLYPQHTPHHAALLGDVAAIVAAERERCASECDKEAALWERDGNGPANDARLCAARIRALGPNRALHGTPARSRDE